MPDESIIVEQVNEEFDAVDVLEDIDEVVQNEPTRIVNVDDVELFTVDSDEAFGALGEPNEQLRHPLLTDRDLPDQHPIAAITGLRNELDKIEALQTVYSDKKNQANYYLWQDENSVQENRIGYFVTVGAYATQVKLCAENDEVLGVVVDNAAFIGGQSDLARDYKYALVAHDSIVAVRCELDVQVGDMVVPNDYSYAQKSDNGYGYKVLELHNIEGVEFAIINLDVSVNQVGGIGQRVDSLEDRMDNAEHRIDSAINVANQAYNRAVEAEETSVDAVQKAIEALNKSDMTAIDVNRLEDIVMSIDRTSEESKNIAESAATSAEAMRNEAIAKADQALSEALNFKQELENKVAELNAGLDGSVEELYRTQNELINTRDDLTESIESLEDELVPLSTWTDGEKSGIVGYVARANENAATLGTLVKWQGETDTSIAGFKQEVAATYATIESLTQLDTKTTTAIAGVKQEATATYATITSLTSFETATNQSLTGITQRVDENEASIEDLVSWKGTASEFITSVTLKANQNESSIDSLTTWKDSATTSLTQVTEKATQNESSIRSLTVWKDDTVTSISNIEQRTGDNESSITQLTLWQNENTSVIAGIQTKANDNAASIESLTSWQNEKATTIASIQELADENSGKITQLANWKSSVEPNVSKIATIETMASEARTSVSNIVKSVGKDGTITAASIVTAINGDSSSISLNANKININGVISANNTFKIDTSGYFSATGGTIGGWTISSSGLYKGANSMTSTTAGTFIGTAGIRQYKDDTHYVNIQDGVVTAKGVDLKTGTIGGWKIVGSSLEGHSDIGNTLYFFANPAESSHWIAVRNSDAEYPFYVGYDGTVYANKLRLGWDDAVIEPYSENSVHPDGIRMRVYDPNDTAVYTSMFTLRDYNFYAGVLNGSSIRMIRAGDITLTAKRNGYLDGSWYVNSDEAITSDINKKNTITPLSDKYEVLFDNLVGSTYKYNDGTSNRLHVGFIAQAVKDAMDTAGLDGQEFAGLVIKNNDDGTQDWYLRYSEFIALNTWQLQKSKQRIAELEDKVAQLEKLLNGD